MRETGRLKVGRASQPPRAVAVEILAGALVELLLSGRHTGARECTKTQLRAQDSNGAPNV